MTSVAYIEPRGQARPALAPVLFVVAVFVSAALVFLVEPLVGKLLLPRLGGSAAIWNTSLAFFQIALLAGYGYAHALQRLGPVRRQMLAHLGVLTLAALVLPLRISTLFGAPWSEAPALWLAATLAVSLGAPFAALSATAPLLQAWWVRLHPEREGRAWGLYAASNLGSLIALAAYPAVVEPLLGLARQAQLWSLAYAGFALLLAAATFSAWRVQAPVAEAVPVALAPTSWRRRALWIALAAAPASLLAGVTAHVSADVASIPFLWVLPLELYLASFVYAFARPGHGPSAWALAVQMVAVPLALMMLFEPEVAWTQLLAVHLLAFGVTALVCHQALAAKRPEPARLTEFYLCLSVGGVIGGSFNAFVAPVVFPEVWEYPAVLVLACLARPSVPPRRDSLSLGWMVAGLVWVAPLWIPTLVLPAMARQALMLVPVVMAVMLRQRAVPVTLLFAALALAGEVQGVGRYREHHRSFFGVIHITELEPQGLGPTRIMVHGTTLHGVQALGANRCRPTSYYAPTTVIGRVFAREHARGPLRMGVAGLGAGTVASFVRRGDSMRFFEIDPLVRRLALDPREFSYLRGCAQGPVDVVIGDARLTLAAERAASYDLLMLDAFASDAVPTHLLTQEAMRSYLRLLKPGGLLLLHLSNRNLELTGPAAAALKSAGADVLKGEHWVEEGVSPYVETGGIVLIAATGPRPLDPYRGDPEFQTKIRPARAWSDDYTTLWDAMIAHWRDE